VPDDPNQNSASALDTAYNDGDNAPQDGVAPCPANTWFRVRLVDEDGQIMAGEDFIVVDSAGARHEGKLDQNGEFYIPPSIPFGKCTVQFPNVHLNPKKRKK